MNALHAQIINISSDYVKTQSMAPWFLRNQMDLVVWMLLLS
jgi:hypothetical protein